MDPASSVMNILSDPMFATPTNIRNEPDELFDVESKVTQLIPMMSLFNPWDGFQQRISVAAFTETYGSIRRIWDISSRARER